MKYLLAVMAVLMLYSCKSSDFKRQVEQADEVTVHFYNNAHADSIIKIVHTTNKDAVEKLSSFIDDKEIKVPECGHDGDIIFMKGNTVIQSVNFNLLQLSCRHFAFSLKNGKVTTRINNEAADFLTSLWAGKTYY